MNINTITNKELQLDPNVDFKNTLGSIDFSDIKLKLMDVKEGLGWTKDQAEEGEKWYRKFLFLQEKYPDKSIVPTGVIDAFWHYHILDTRKYQKDCNMLFGSILHHYPYFGMKGDEKEFKNAFSETKRLFQKHFNLSCIDDIKYFENDKKNAMRCGDGEPSKCGNKCGRAW